MRFSRWAVVVALLLTMTPAASAAEDKWVSLADRTYTESVAAVAAADSSGVYVRVQFVAPLAWYAGTRFGWRDERTQGWLRRLYALRTPTGGYGLGAPFDAFGDKTVNPADTAYSITVAWHVGRTLIAGYDGGGVPASAVREAASMLNTVGASAGERCPAYSEHVNDLGKPCVWNVSAAAAWFLGQALRRGLVPEWERREAGAKVRTWLADVVANYRDDLGGWTYQANSSPLQDAWHNAPTVAAVLGTPLGPRALAGQFRNFPASGANADLIPYDCAKAEPNYPMIFASATKPVTAPVDVLQSRAGYAPALQEIARACYGPR
ncbi:hypothetical protein SAMN05421504_103908 [Amycolatopsis xylanica]|uniref:Prenyltransferase and squalene oxidase repeat-containing protein n=1 Tax=Amycolatopsis xylanica TaxID=589385 RepID=A0A1H3ENN2_9PSEU|nr:hypothetical protein [Amycolatopsis xylanica]SDX80356.1 hypothetical protein SAMN05421504_103908 [Amycolatopsis xylanica]